MSSGYYIETFGCQMNERDSESLAGMLEALGLAPVNSPEDARVVVLNTCSVREKPHQKVFSRLGDLRALKRDDASRIIAVCGCMAQVVPDQIIARAPFVDIVLGPRNLSQLPELLTQRLAAPGQGRQADVCADNSVLSPDGLPTRRKQGIGAFVNVTYGCNNACAYCVVPLARGREVSRSPETVIAEVREAVGEGFVEVTLLGQNVNSYGADLGGGCAFPALLAAVDAVEGLQRIRFTTSHPKDCSLQLLEAIAGLPKVCEHLHLPLQAGDDAILRAMGRGYGLADYLELIRTARDLVPQIAITTDLMVGFPGETEEQFQNTLAACEAIGFDQAFVFIYSDRPGVRAAGLPGKLPYEVKRERLKRLSALQNGIARERNRCLVGQVFEVLVESRDPRTAGHVRGRTRQNKLMIFPGDEDWQGRVAHVRADQAFMWGFKGTAVGAG